MAKNKVNGVKAIGRTELLEYRKGKTLTVRNSILACCYDCMGGYTDGKYDCGVSDCPLYYFMPYRVIDPKENRDEV